MDDLTVNPDEVTVAKYQKFEDLPVWQEAARLYNAVLDLLETPQAPFSPGFLNQLARGASGPRGNGRSQRPDHQLNRL